VVAGPFPHDPATAVTIRVAIWSVGDSTLARLGGVYRLEVGGGFQHLKRASSGRDGQLWGRLEALATAICARIPCLGTDAAAPPIGAPAPVTAPAQPPTQAQPQRTCCRVCSSGKPCGNSCIAANRTCRQPPGCAC